MLEATAHAADYAWYILWNIAIPGVLFIASCMLWEKRCLLLKDCACSLPLPSGNMGFPLVGEMFHFLFVVSKAF